VEEAKDTGRNQSNFIDANGLSWRRVNVGTNLIFKSSAIY
jgi:hypothetical protein